MSLVGGGAVFDRNIKVLLLGDSGVGKTALMMRFTENKFSPSFVSTVGIDFKYAMMHVGEQKVRLEIWDTAGQERFKSIAMSYLRGAQGILIVYDITDRKTFAKVDAWLSDVQTYAELSVDLVLVGTKCDLAATRAVLTEEGQALANAHNMPFFEVSAKEGLRVAEPFETVAKAVLQRLQNKADGPVKGINLSSMPPPSSSSAAAPQGGGCCS